MKYVCIALKLNGLDIDGNSLCQSIWLMLILILNVTHAILFIAYPTSIDLQWLSYIVPFFVSIGLKIYLRIRGARIGQLLSTMDTFLIEDQRINLKKNCVLYLVGYLSTCLLYIIGNVYYTVSLGLQTAWLSNWWSIDELDWSKSTFSLVLLINDSLFIIQFVFLTGVLYLTSLSMVSEVTKSYFEACVQTTNSTDMILKADQLLSMYEDFGRLFGSFSVTWCTLIYVQMCGVIVGAVQLSTSRDSSQTPTNWISDLIGLASNTGYITMILWLAARKVDYIRDEKQKLIRRLSLLSVDNRSVLNFIQAIDTIDFELTGSGLFKIEPTMFLNMYGSLITFSVLFAQLTGANIADG